MVAEFHIFRIILAGGSAVRRGMVGVIWDAVEGRFDSFPEAVVKPTLSVPLPTTMFRSLRKGETPQDETWPRKGKHARNVYDFAHLDPAAQRGYVARRNWKCWKHGDPGVSEVNLPRNSLSKGPERGRTGTREVRSVLIGLYVYFCAPSANS